MELFPYRRLYYKCRACSQPCDTFILIISERQNDCVKVNSAEIIL